MPGPLARLQNLRLLTELSPQVHTAVGVRAQIEHAAGALGMRLSQQERAAATVRAWRGRLSYLSVFLYKTVLDGALYGRAGRLTAKNGGFRPGQALEKPGTREEDVAARAAAATEEEKQQEKAISPGPYNHSDTTLRISLVILHTEYTGRRDNDFNVYA